jgi:hypothetical protein
MRLLPFLHLCLCADGSLGFMSGHRKSAYFIVGFDHSHFAYFDPHTTKNAIVDQDFSSCYSLPLNTLKASALNPSILLGFIVSTMESLDDLLSVLIACHNSPIAVTEALDQGILDQVVDFDEFAVVSNGASEGPPNRPSMSGKTDEHLRK